MDSAFSGVRPVLVSRNSTRTDTCPAGGLKTPSGSRGATVILVTWILTGCPSMVAVAACPNGMSLAAGGGSVGAVASVSSVAWDGLVTSDPAGSAVAGRLLEQAVRQSAAASRTMVMAG